MKLTPEWRVYTLGAILLVALTTCSRNFGDRGGPYFMASLTLAGIVYLLAVRDFFATPKFERRISRRVVIVGLILAAVWHVEFLRLPAGADDDIHRYVWDGRLQRLGYNPYLVVPSDPAFAGLHTPETRTLNNSDLPSPYPAGAQLFFRVITAIHESTFAMKVAFVVCEFAIVFVLLDVLRRSQKPAHLVLAFAWNPLVAIEVAGSGHIDIVGALFLVISVAALGLAIAVKFLPLVLLPLYWKRVRIRDAALAAALIGLLYVPFLNRSFFNRGRIPLGSLGTYVQGFRFNGPVFAILHYVASPQLLAGLAVLVGLVTATFLRRGSLKRAAPDASSDVFASDQLPWNQFAWPMAASLLFAPVVFPWYLLWLLPFLTSASTLLIIIWTVCIIPTYIMLHLSKITGSWGALPVWVMLLEYGCLAIAGTILALHRVRRVSRQIC
jgi:alpha-1,6-mannosyltransferase